MCIHHPVDRRHLRCIHELSNELWHHLNLQSAKRSQNCFNHSHKHSPLMYDSPILLARASRDVELDPAQQFILHSAAWSSVLAAHLFCVWLALAVVITVTTFLAAASIAAGAVQSAVNIAGYTFYQGRDAVPGEIGPQNKYMFPKELAEKCSKDPACRAFNTKGWLKSSDVMASGTWSNDAREGLYIKINASATPPATAPPAATSAGTQQTFVNIPGYTFHQGRDAVPGEIGPQNKGLTPAALAEKCSKDPACKAFNTNGWLKSSNVMTSGTWSTNPSEGLYMKLTALSTPPANTVALAPSTPSSTRYEDDQQADDSSSYDTFHSSYYEDGQQGDDSSSYTPQSSSYEEGQQGDDSSSYAPHSSSYEEGQQQGDDSSSSTPQSSSYEGEEEDDSNSYTPHSSSYEEGQQGNDSSSYTPHSSSFAEGQQGDDSSSSSTPQSSSYEGEEEDDSSSPPQSSSYEGEEEDDSSSYTPHSSSYEEGQQGDDSSYTPQSSSYEEGQGEDDTTTPQRQHYRSESAQANYETSVRERYGGDDDDDENTYETSVRERYGGDGDGRRRRLMADGHRKFKLQ